MIVTWQGRPQAFLKASDRQQAEAVGQEKLRHSMRAMGPNQGAGEARPGREAGRPDLRGVAAALPPGSPALLQAAPEDPADRRVARLLLREAAAFGGGEAISLPMGDVLLGGTSAAAERAGHQLHTLLGLDAARLTLPQGLPALEAWLPRASRPPAPEPAGWAALEAHCAALPIAQCAALTLFGAMQGAPPAAQRLGPRLPPLAEPEARALARDWLTRRVLQALASPAGFAPLPRLRPGLRLMLDLPSNGLAGGAMMGRLPGPPPVALLPFSLLADGAAFAALRARLEGAGWEVALLADSSAALEWPVPAGCWLAAPLPISPPPALPERLIALGAAPSWPLPNGSLLECPA
jgi:hypothetical protein